MHIQKHLRGVCGSTEATKIYLYQTRPSPLRRCGGGDLKSDEIGNSLSPIVRCFLVMSNLILESPSSIVLKLSRQPRHLYMASVSRFF